MDRLLVPRTAVFVTMEFVNPAVWVRIFKRIYVTFAQTHAANPVITTEQLRSATTVQQIMESWSWTQQLVLHATLPHKETVSQSTTAPPPQLVWSAIATPSTQSLNAFSAVATIEIAATAIILIVSTAIVVMPSMYHLDVCNWIRR